MSGRWWRAYSGARHDPKLLRLTDKDFRWWFNLLCMASEKGGRLPPLRDIAAEFRTTEHVVGVVLDRLRNAGLLVLDGEPGPEAVYLVHNWDKRQYVSDVSNERVKRYRDRKRNVTGNAECNVSVTPSETEADTDTDSVPNGTGAAAPVDPVKALFDAGVKLLTAADMEPGKARSFIGKWRSDYGDQSVMAAIGAAGAAKVSAPHEWVTKYLANHAKPQARQPFETFEQARVRRGRELLAQ